MGICDNINKYGSSGTHCIDFHIKNDEVAYFDRFGVKHMPKTILKIFEKKKLYPTWKLLLSMYCTRCISFNKQLTENFLGKLFIKRNTPSLVSGKNKVFIRLEFLGKSFFSKYKTVNWNF